MAPVPPLYFDPVTTKYVPLKVSAKPSCVGHANPETSIVTVFFPVEFRIVPAPAAGRQSPTVDIGSDELVSSMLSANVNDPLLKRLPRIVCAPVKHSQVWPVYKRSRERCRLQQRVPRYPLRER
jgi:hypothetical protein